MKKSFHASFFGAMALFFLLSTTPVVGQEITTYYLIRHAEKDLSDPVNRNPHLTSEGQQRAHTWKTILQHVPFDQIYATEYYRTQETAAPIAQDRKLSVIPYDPRNLYNEAFANATQGKTVLVVGHSNTTPQLANKILGKQNYASIDERLHGNLYILQKVGERVTCQLLSLESIDSHNNAN